MTKKIKIFCICLLLTLTCSCASVLQKSVMERGEKNPDLNMLVKEPERYRGHLYIFGGVLASVKVTADGSPLEGIYVPVDRSGYLGQVPRESTRFLALYKQGILDPVIYQTGRLVTLAGTFLETRRGKLGERDYVYPLFQVEDIYLWPKQPTIYYYGPPPFYPGYPFYPAWYP